MTTRYTQDEWLDIIDRAQKSMPDTTIHQYKAPNIGTKEFAKTIDHTLLKLDATREQIDKLCEEAKFHDFKVRLSKPSVRNSSGIFVVSSSSLFRAKPRAVLVVDMSCISKSSDSVSSTRHPS